jgi:predicted PurR-regulated permease PerM
MQAPSDQSSQTKKYLRRAIPIAFVLFFLLVATVFSAILLPFVLATFVAYIFAPAVAQLCSDQNKRRLPRWGAVLIVYGAFFGVVGLFGAFALPKLVGEVARLPNAVGELAKELQDDVQNSWIPYTKEQLRKYFPAKPTSAPVKTPEKPVRPLPERPILRLTPGPEGTAELDLSAFTLDIQPMEDGKFRIQAISPRPPVAVPTDPADAVLNGLQNGLEDAPSHLDGLVGQILSLVQRLLSGIIATFVSLVLTFMIAAFLLIGLEDIFTFVRSMVPPEYHNGYDDLLHRLDKSLQGVIRGQLKICLVNGVLTGIGFGLLGLNFTFILAVLAAVMSLIPIFGSILSSIPAVAIAFAQTSQGPDDYSGSTRAALVLGWILVIHAVEANLLNPKIMGDSAKINPILVVLSLVIGEHWFGLVGALLAVPTFAILQTLFMYAMERAGLIIQEPPKPPKIGWILRVWRHRQAQKKEPPQLPQQIDPVITSED